MTEEIPSEASPIKSENIQIETPTDKKTSRIKKANSPKPKQGAGLNKIKQEELHKWTVFVQPETKVSCNKAAQKAGLTVTDWLDSRLREAATAELTKKAKPPIKTEDVADILRQFTDDMTARQEAAQAAQAATIQAQNDLIQQQGEQLATIANAVKNTQPKSLKEMLFGRKSAD